MLRNNVSGAPPLSFLIRERFGGAPYTVRIIFMKTLGISWTTRASPGSSFLQPRDETCIIK
jgi:hypothetical protein